MLYFTPAFRAAVLRHVPEPGAEFCLACELLFLFRLMLSAGGTPCQVGRRRCATRRGTAWGAASFAHRGCWDWAATRPVGAVGPARQPTLLAALLFTPRPRQASHLLRALRQNREAAALGLLDAASGAPPAPGDARGVEAAVAARQAGGALQRRIASLTRFLLEHLSK